MNPRLAQAVKRGLFAAGHYRRRLARDRFPGVAVLCYHGILDDGAARAGVPFADLHVAASELEAHCRLLADSCHPIDLARWRAAEEGGAPLPARPVLVTFDDGYAAVERLAAPILARFRVPAVAFVCSDVVAEGRLHWYDTLARAEGEAAVERAKSLDFAAWSALEIAHRRPARPDDPSRPLTAAELVALATRPGIAIGSHSATHPILARAPIEEQRAQIERAHRRIAEWTGASPAAFAYPNGRPGIDYTADTVGLLEAAAYRFGFTTREGFARAGEPPLERSRFLIHAGLAPEELAHRLAYSWRRS